MDVFRINSAHPPQAKQDNLFKNSQLAVSRTGLNSVA
jgi:hypothetical protein